MVHFAANVRMCVKGCEGLFTFYSLKILHVHHSAIARGNTRVCICTYVMRYMFDY
jgi:hypothetical protein